MQGYLRGGSGAHGAAPSVESSCICRLCPWSLGLAAPLLRASSNCSCVSSCNPAMPFSRAVHDTVAACITVAVLTSQATKLS